MYSVVVVAVPLLGCSHGRDVVDGRHLVGVQITHNHRPDLLPVRRETLQTQIIWYFEEN